MDISRLEFFNSKGYKIPIQLTKTVSFTLIGNMFRSDRNYGWREDASGYFTLDENNKIVSTTIENPGSTFGFDPSTWNTSINYYDATVKLIDEVIVTVTVNGKTYTKSFNNDDSEDNILTYFDIETGIKKEYVRARTTSNTQDNVVYTFCVEKFLPRDPEFFIEDTFGEMLAEAGEDLGSLYPSIKFLGSFEIEKASVGLAGIETLFILEKQSDGTYRRPKSNNQMLRFELPSNGNVKFVKYAEDWISEDLAGKEFSQEEIDYSKVYWSKYKVYDLVSEYDTQGIESEPLVLTVGFLADEEGCYQDVMSVYTMDHISNPDKALEKNAIGYIAIQSEAIGEDERYRTLFADFGIPDPRDYQEVFKDMPIQEEGQDWNFINKKSKQLFLSYTDIFPYVGTYKALINAVKFLGYNDIYFKEWFIHFDGNFESKISYESLDISTGMTLQSKLERVGVTLDDFIEWKKLNQLSLVYKINEEDEEYDDVDYYVRDSSDNWNEEPYTMRFSVPTTKPVYSYLNLEVLAKLFALKEWLEKYILNVNCQIIDVTGEGVYFLRFEDVGYTVGYETFTEEKEEHLSPMFDLENSALKMRESNASICCTLKEIKDGMSFNDLADKKIKAFINKIFEAPDDSSMIEMKKDEWYDSSTVATNPEEFCLVGKPASIAMPFEELEYELTIDTSCGTMMRGVGYWDEDPSTGDKSFVELPLLVLENEMYVFKNQKNEIEFSEPPIIRVKSGELRKPFGNWNNNVKYTIQTYFDTKARHTKYSFQSEDTGFHREYNDYVTLYPRYVGDGEDKKCVSKLKYTSDNKYNVPMLIIENYDTYDNFFLDDKKSELAKKYIDTSTSISDDFESIGEVTDEELRIIKNKREQLHQEAINEYNDEVFQYTSLYDSEDSSNGLNKYILIINEGFIENKENTVDEDVDHRAKIVFEPSYTEHGGEQSIYTEYTYKSKMTPSIEFDSSLYESQYQSIKEEYYAKIDELDLLIDDASNFRGAILEDPEYQYETRTANEMSEYYTQKAAEMERERQGYLITYNLLSGKGKALEEYLTWMLSRTNYSSLMVDQIQADLEAKLSTIKDRFLCVYQSEKEKAYTKLLSDLEELKNQCFSFHKERVFNVRHIGDYSLVVKGVDGYNAPFAAKASNTARVCGQFPSIYILDSNTLGSEDIVQADSIAIGEDPTLWPTYRRPISSTGITDSNFEYLDWSYVLDTPKKGDFLKVANLTERVNKILTDDPDIRRLQAATGNLDIIKIILNDENPQHQNLFYTGALIKLFFIDRNTNELVDNDEQIVGPFIVTEYKPIPEEDMQEADDNYVILEYNTSYEEFRAMSKDSINDVNNKNIDCYACLISRIEVDPANISNDYAEKTSTVKIKDTRNFNNLAFGKDQCIKMEFAQMTYVGETPMSFDETQEIVTERYTSGTTYRIKDCWYDTSDFAEVYVLDGLVNSDLLVPGIYKNGIYNYLSDIPRDNIKNVPYRVRCTIAPAHTTYSSYVIQATSDADERNSKGYVEYTDNWHAKEFLDNSFSYTISKFNIYDAYRDWFKEMSTKTLYLHRNPVINNVGNNMIAMSDDEEITYSTDYLSIWDIYVNQGKAKEDNVLVYQVTNDLVPITINYGGEYHFKLTSIDRFGNLLVNNSNGYLKALQA